MRRYDGIDPIQARRAERLKVRLEAAKAIIFKECAESYIKAHRASWRNHKHRAQWRATLTTYAEPVVGKAPVQAIDTGLVLKVLEPIWATKPETAGRVRGRMEAVLDWAKVRGYRAGENPARWRGHLDKLLPARGKVHKVRHHPALPYGELPGFLSAVRKQDGIAAAALEFTVLTAARTGETIFAKVALSTAAWGKGMPLKPTREGTWVWVASVTIGLMPLLLRLCGNYIDSDPNVGMAEFWNIDAFAKDLLLLCIVTCGLGLVSLLSKHEILVHVRPPGTVHFPKIYKFIGVILLLIFSAFFYGAAAAGHAHTIWPAAGLTIGTLLATLALEVASVAMAL